MADFSKELKTFIVNNKLYTNIGGKNYVHVEGWQFAGASMGIFPVVVKLEDLSEGPEASRTYKFRAEVKLVRLGSDEVLGYGIAICSKAESKKKSFDEYAVASMAQTRAIGKAFRMTLGWIMKLAGYEATPAEEADEPAAGDGPAAPAQLPLNDIKFLVVLKLSAMKPSDKATFLKEHTGSISDAKLTEEQYRSLYAKLQEVKTDAGA
jgi:hypothetical protein